MAHDREFDSDSLREGVETAGQPPRPASDLPEDAYEVEILRTIADGTQTLNSSMGLSRYPAELASLSFPEIGPAVLTLAPRDAAMLGLYRLIEGLRWHSIDLKALMGGEARTSVTPHKLKRVFFEWPDSQKESMPAQSALIMVEDRASYENPSGFTSRLDEDTADRFGKGTMLRYLGEVQVSLLLVFKCVHKDQRRGLEAKIGQLLAAERHGDSAGRRIVLPEYFSRMIRYTLVDTERPDDATAALGNDWKLGVTVAAEVPHVELVVSPGTVDGTVIDADATPGS